MEACYPTVSPLTPPWLLEKACKTISPTPLFPPSEICTILTVFILKACIETV